MNSIKHILLKSESDQNENYFEQRIVSIIKFVKCEDLPSVLNIKVI